jgi:uncharacterized protein YebE (UPF0316 family)
VASELIALLGVYSIFRHETGLRIRVVLPLLRPVLAAVAVLLTVRACQPATAHIGSLMHLVVTGVLTVLVYVVALALVRGLPAEINGVIAKCFGKIKS